MSGSALSCLSPSPLPSPPMQCSHNNQKEFWHNKSHFIPWLFVVSLCPQKIMCRFLFRTHAPFAICSLRWSPGCFGPHHSHHSILCCGHTGLSVAYPFSSGSSQPRDRTEVSCIAGGFFTSWATRVAPAPHLLKPIQVFPGFFPPHLPSSHLISSSSLLPAYRTHELPQENQLWFSGHTISRVFFMALMSNALNELLVKVFVCCLSSLDRVGAWSSQGQEYVSSPITTPQYLHQLANSRFSVNVLNEQLEVLYSLKLFPHLQMAIMPTS